MKAYLSLLVALVLTSCSISGRDTSSSLTLPAAPPAPQGIASAWTLLPISEKPKVYRVQRAGLAPDEALFLTAVKDCGIPKNVSRATSFRQLLVGMQDIEIKLQEEAQFGGVPAIYSEVTAAFEGDKLNLASISARKDDCAVDLVVWIAKQEGAPQLSPTDIQEFKRYASETVPTF